jgi:alkylation response protein AidB-like acyl-CoA dehydrogenase
MLIEAARLATWCAAKRLEERKPGSLATAAYAYLEAVECALFCTREAVQLLGGHGFLRDHPVEKWMRDARALSLLCGGRDSAADDVNVWGAAKWLEPAHEPPPATEA